MDKEKVGEISLSPIGREEIHRLEYALLVGTLFRSEVLEMLRNPEERLTWVDSLAVAAAALARERAKMSISQIADELGRTEATIRSHLTGKTKAGQLVKETLEKFAREGIKIEVIEKADIEEVKQLHQKMEKLEEENRKLQEDIQMLNRKISEVKQKLQEVLTLI